MTKCECSEVESSKLEIFHQNQACNLDPKNFLLELQNYLHECGEQGVLLGLYSPETRLQRPIPVKGFTWDSGKQLQSVIVVHDKYGERFGVKLDLLRDERSVVNKINRMRLNVKSKFVLGFQGNN